MLYLVLWESQSVYHVLNVEVAKTAVRYHSILPTNGIFLTIRYFNIKLTKLYANFNIFFPIYGNVSHVSLRIDMDMVLNPLQKDAESLSGQEKVRSVYFLSVSLFQDLHSSLTVLFLLLIKEIVPKMSPI